MMKLPFLKTLNIATSATPFTLDSGDSFSFAPVSYEDYGILNPQKDNVILILHGLTSHPHGASHHSEDQAGWWEPLIGAGKIFDTDRYYILVPNILGSSYGTLSPLTVNPVTEKAYGADFPSITVRDMVRLHRRLLDVLEISVPKLVVGGSLGGMQALEWAMNYPEDGADVVSIVAPERSSAQAIGFNHTMRQAIFNDPHWQQGNYSSTNPPNSGLGLARMIAMMTYQTEASMARKFGRLRRNEEWEIGNYLDYQGKKLAQRFDTNCYLRLIEAMDSHDVSDRSDYQEKVSHKKGRILLIGDHSDLLYQIEHQQVLAAKWSGWGANAHWQDLETLNGHDSFLIDFPVLEKKLVQFLKE